MNAGFITRANPSWSLRSSLDGLPTDLLFMNRLFISTDSTRRPVDSRIFIEVTIKGKGMADSKPFHNDKARTVHEAEQVISIGPEYFQSPLKIFFSYLLKQGRFTMEQGSRYANS
jgi:hypothetical protein